MPWGRSSKAGPAISGADQAGLMNLNKVSKMNPEKIMEGMNSPTVLYVALAATVGFFLAMVAYALL